MAVTETRLRSVGLTGALTGKSMLSAKRSYTAQWFVKTDSQLDTAKTVIDYFIASADHPKLGTIYDFGNDADSSSRCVKLSPSLIDKSGGIWIVSADYESPEDSGDGGDGDSQTGKDINGNETDNPLEWHDEIDIGYTQITIPAELATFQGANLNGLNGQAIPGIPLGRVILPCNSAFTPFDPGLEWEIDVKVVRITKNRADFDGNLMNGFIGCVNNAQCIADKPDYNFKDTWGPLTARIKNISASFQMANKIKFWKTTIEVHVSPLGWRKLICDRGMSMLLTPGLPRQDGSTVSNSDRDANTLEHLRDANGQPIPQPVLFDGKGRPLDLGGDPVFLEYQLYEEINFAQITW